MRKGTVAGLAGPLEGPGGGVGLGAALLDTLVGGRADSGVALRALHPTP